MLSVGALAGRPFYVKVAFLGLLLFVAAFLIFLPAVFISGEWEPLIFFAINMAIAGLIGFALVRWGTAGPVLAFIGGLFGLLFFAPGIPLGLSNPDSFFDFATNLLALPGLMLMAAGGVIGFVQSRKPEFRTEAKPSEALAIRGLLAALVVLSLLSAVLTVLGKDSVSAEEKSSAVAVRMKKTDFTPGDLTARNGQKVVVKNSDPFLHTFTIDALGIDVTVLPGSEKLIALTGAKTGETYAFHCKVPGHEAMDGALAVR